MHEQPENKKERRVIDLDAIINGPGVARYQERLRAQGGLFDERLRKQLATATGKRTLEAINQMQLGTRTQQHLKELSGQISSQALKSLRESLNEQQKPRGALSNLLQDMRPLPDFAAQIERPIFEADDSISRIAEMHAREKREQIERELAMVNNLALLLEAFKRSEAREAAALERAERAEKREQAAIARGEQIQRRSFWINVVAAAFAVIGGTAAVIALFVV
jgi:hypothetical protein